MYQARLRCLFVLAKGERVFFCIGSLIINHRTYFLTFSLLYHERFLQLESYLEARLWNDVFVAAQNYLGVPIGTIRATVLLETITAAFEMEEILFVRKNNK